MTEAPRPSTEEKFWSRVDKRGPDECWPWTGGRNTDGYGKAPRATGSRPIGRGYTAAHRVSWAIHFGPVPDGLWVLHHCDNPPCVNPAHLWLGTNLDNIRDRDAKGRSAASRTTHCPAGHEYSLSNTLLRGGKRRCRTCEHDQRVAHPRDRTAYNLARRVQR